LAETIAMVSNVKPPTRTGLKPSIVEMGNAFDGVMAKTSAASHAG
jgi:hypothetical protein